ncbi:MAG: DUF4388 domain-containing protein [Candidatus Melainabacteria bacterium]|nr:DUF4388 domain-containing protein [Candidatus Melainabacteria bacterium]
MVQDQQGQPKSTRVLPSSPSMQVVHQMLAEALEELNDRVEVTWKSPDPNGQAIFTLTVQSDPVGRDPNWQLFQTSGGTSSCLWKYASCDTLLVFNRVVASCGEAISAAHLTAPQGAAGQESEFYYQPRSKKSQKKTVPLPVLANQTALAKRNTVLNGELAFIQISALLQSIQLAKMTGRLQVDGRDGAAEVFFVDGKPVHCTTPDGTGNESIYELITWQEGKFFFQPQVVTQKRTVSETLDSLVIQGVQLLDKLNLMRNSGFREDAVLAKTNEAISGVDLETMLSVGEPQLLEVQRQLYHAIDGNTAFEDLAAALNLPRSQWVPALSHLFRCRLIGLLSDVRRGATGKPALVPKTVDSAAVQAVMMSLRRPDTGMFNYPAFLYFLEQEYFRAHRAGTPLSVIIFEMRVKTGVKEVIREPLPTSALNESVLRITTTKRHNDLLAHYEGFDYALLCPDTRGEGARIFANRIVQALNREPLSNTVKPGALCLSFGIACIPEDFLELGFLLSAAETARNHSVETETEVVLYRDLG